MKSERREEEDEKNFSISQEIKVIKSVCDTLSSIEESEITLFD